MQHADEAAQFFQRNFLWCELLFEAMPQIVEARQAIEPIQDRKFFFLKTEVIQPDRIFDNPILPPLIALLRHYQIGTPTDCERPSGTGNQTVSKSGH